MTTKTRIPSAKQIIKNLGGAKEIYDQLLSYSKRVSLMDEQRRELTAKHPEKWVAMNHDQIVAIGDSLNDVLIALDERGIAREAAVVQFLDPNPKCMIL